MGAVCACVSAVSSLYVDLYGFHVVYTCVCLLEIHTQPCYWLDLGAWGCGSFISMSYGFNSSLAGNCISGVVHRSLLHIIAKHNRQKEVLSWTRILNLKNMNTEKSRNVSESLTYSFTFLLCHLVFFGGENTHKIHVPINSKRSFHNYYDHFH